MAKVPLGENFLLRTDIKVKGNIEIEFYNIYVTLPEDAPFEVVNPETNPELCLIKKHSKHTCWLSVSAKRVGDHVHWGTVSVRWRLKGQYESCKKEDFFSLEFNLPHLETILPNFVVHVEYPSTGKVNVPFVVRVQVRNNTDSIEELIQSIKQKKENNKCFLLEGSKENRLRMLPHSTSQLLFVLHPLVPGTQVLPSFVFRSAEENQQKIAPIRSHHVFIHP